MGSTSRAIMAGVGAGLQTLGHGLAEQYKQEQANLRVDERLAKEDAFKERELTMREDAAALQKAAADRQARFDNYKLSHLNLTRGLAGAGDNVIEQANVISKYFPDQRQYKNNPGLASTMKGADGKQPFMVWDVSYNEENPTTGELVPDPITGGTKQIQSASGPKIFWTEDDYTNFKAKLVNPSVFTAFATQEITTAMAIKRDNAIAEAYAGTEKGGAEIAKTESQTKLNIANAEQADRGAEAGKKMGSVTGLDGKEIKLTTPEVNQLINDTKSMKDKFPGISSGEVYRIGKAMENPSMSEGLNQTAQRVVRDPSKKQSAVKGIMKVYRVSKSTATDIIDEAMRGVEDDSPSFWDKMFGNKPMNTEDDVILGGS